MVVQTALYNALFAKDRSKRKAVKDALPQSQESLESFVHSLLMKEDPRRSEDEHRVIVNYLANIPIIADVRAQISEDSFQFLTRSCRLVCFSELEIVCKFGEPSTSVYYVVEGSVAVTGVNASRYSKQMLRDSLLSVVTRNHIFGEAGVMAHSFRTANCVCMTACKLLVFEGRAYRDSVGRAIAASKEKEVALLTRVKLLQTWESHKVSAFYEGIVNTRRSFAFGTLIFGAGQHLDNVYIVVRGEVELSAYAKKPADGEGVPFFRVHTRPGLLKPLLLLSEGCWFGDENNPAHAKSQRFFARVASSACELYVLPRPTLLENALFKDRPRILQLFHDRLALLQERLRAGKAAAPRPEPEPADQAELRGWRLKWSRTNLEGLKKTLNSAALGLSRLPRDRPAPEARSSTKLNESKSSLALSGGRTERRAPDPAGSTVDFFTLCKKKLKTVQSQSELEGLRPSILVTACKSSRLDRKEPLFARAASLHAAQAPDPAHSQTSRERLGREGSEVARTGALHRKMHSLPSDSLAALGSTGLLLRASRAGPPPAPQAGSHRLTRSSRVLVSVEAHHGASLDLKVR